eukprot:8800269-Alexandrium_andersonii.AAC.1
MIPEVTVHMRCLEGNGLRALGGGRWALGVEDDFLGHNPDDDVEQPPPPPPPPQPRVMVPWQAPLVAPRGAVGWGWAYQRPVAPGALDSPRPGRR